MPGTRSAITTHGMLYTSRNARISISWRSRPRFSASRLSCCAAKLLARASVVRPAAVSCNVLRRPSAEDCSRVMRPRGGNVRLGQSAVGADHHQRRELRRADIDRRQRADEVLKHPHLQAPHEIAEMTVEHVERDRRARTPPRRRRPPQGQGRGRAAFRYSHYASPGRSAVLDVVPCGVALMARSATILVLTRIVVQVNNVPSGD